MPIDELSTALYCLVQLFTGWIHCIPTCSLDLYCLCIHCFLLFQCKFSVGSSCCLALLRILGVAPDASSDEIKLQRLAIGRRGERDNSMRQGPSRAAWGALQGARWNLPIWAHDSTMVYHVMHLIHPRSLLVCWETCGVCGEHLCGHLRVS